MTDPDAGDEARALKREHKHTQELIEGGEAVAPREYAAYQERTEWGGVYANLMLGAAAAPPSPLR